MAAEAEQLFYEKMRRAIAGLFECAQQRDELKFALSLCPEFRGMQDAGWNTATETNRAFHEYLEFIQEMPHSTMRVRICLSFYCHLAEASGYYEVLKNMLRVTQGLRCAFRPFDDLVDRHRIAGAVIAPNANRIFRDLAGHASELNLTELAEVFRDAFDPDVRNGYAHADYVIVNNELRLPRRNGGRLRVIGPDEWTRILNRGINLFVTLRQVMDEFVHSYDPPRHVIGSVGNEPPGPHVIFFLPERGAFGFATGNEIPRR